MMKIGGQSSLKSMGQRLSLMFWSIAGRAAYRRRRSFASSRARIARRFNSSSALLKMP